ncbi:MAG: FtsQ-type POTRA domain-containing protein [Thermoanaerobaculia bacterium]
MTPYRSQPERAVPFRRRQFVAAHRRRSPFLPLLKPFLGAVLTVGIALAAAGWVQTSASFRLADVRVTGHQRVSADWLSSMLAPLRGQHLLWLSLAEVERRLAAHPWIQGAEIHKQLPNRLLVKVVERRPAGLLRRQEGLYYVDRSGGLIGTYDPALGADDLVLLSGGQETPGDLARALALAEELARLEPEWKSGLSEIEIVGDADFRLFASFLPCPILVSTERLEEGVRNLRRFVHEIVRRYPGVVAVDLRFARQIIIQPAVDPLS